MIPLFRSTGNRKDMEVGPFDALHKLLGSTYQRMSMTEKFDCYFVDNSLMPLMVQVSNAFNFILIGYRRII